jgi:hypothetical protein
MSITRTADYDWVKPPHYRSAWYTYHHENLLRYSLNYSDHINGFISQTINLTIVNENDDFDSNNIQLDISPLCSSSDEHGIYLTKLQIQKLNLIPLEIKKTKLYGPIQTYSGIKLRITSPKCYQYIYYIPNSFVYELPNIFSSAKLIPEIKEFGIPQRQGIIHRDLFYHHALISYNGTLYGLTDELFHMSGIPEIISKNPRCEISQIIAGHGIRSQLFNLNSLLRPLIYPLPLSHPSPDDDNHGDGDDDLPGGDGSSQSIHPSLLEDHIDASITPSSVYLCLKKSLQCYYCQRIHQFRSSAAMIYCPLCRLRHVQSPHVYCSKHCQLAHRQDHLSFYHDTSQTESMIIEPSDLPPHRPPSSSSSLSAVHIPNTNTTTNKKVLKQSQQTEMIKFEKYLRHTSSSSSVPLRRHDRKKRHQEEGEEGEVESEDEQQQQWSRDQSHNEEEEEEEERGGGEGEAVNKRKLQKEQYEKYLVKVESEFQREEIYGVRCDRVEVWVMGFLCFYLVCYSLLRFGDREDYPPHEHDEM